VVTRDTYRPERWTGPRCGCGSLEVCTTWGGRGPEEYECYSCGRRWGLVPQQPTDDGGGDGQWREDRLRSPDSAEVPGAAAGESKAVDA
jgi:hypothetical protein